MNKYDKDNQNNKNFSDINSDKFFNKFFYDHENNYKKTTYKEYILKKSDKEEFTNIYFNSGYLNKNIINGNQNIDYSMDYSHGKILDCETSPSGKYVRMAINKTSETIVVPVLQYSYEDFNTEYSYEDFNKERCTFINPSSTLQPMGRFANFININMFIDINQNDKDLEHLRFFQLEVQDISTSHLIDAQYKIEKFCRSKSVVMKSIIKHKIAVPQCYTNDNQFITDKNCIRYFDQKNKKSYFLTESYTAILDPLYAKYFDSEIPF